MLWYFNGPIKGGNRPYRVIIGPQHLNRTSDSRNLSFCVFSGYYLTFNSIE